MKVRRVGLVLSSFSVYSYGRVWVGELGLSCCFASFCGCCSVIAIASFFSSLSLPLSLSPLSLGDFRPDENKPPYFLVFIFECLHVEFKSIAFKREVITIRLCGWFFLYWKKEKQKQMKKNQIITQKY